MIKEVFNSILPYNIKQIPLMKDAMDIFIEAIEEKCGVSQDIKNIFKEDNNEIAREEFIKIYLDDLYRYFTKAKTDSTIQEEIDYVNAGGYHSIPRDFIGDMTQLFNDEHFVTSKAFKQKKGTEEAIEYMYNFVESLVLEEERRGAFTFTPGEPFHFNVEGGMYKSFYDKIVKPIAHPLGFTYVYLQILKITLEDNYGTECTFSDFVVEVRCLSGVTDVYANTVSGFEKEVTSNGDVKTTVTFDDGTYLLQTLNPIHVVYYAGNGDVLKDYTGHCALYLDYTTTCVSLITDELQIIPEHYLWDSWCLDREVLMTFPDSPMEACTSSWDYIIGEFTVGTPPDVDTGYIGANSQHLLQDEVEFLVTFDTRTLHVASPHPVWVVGHTTIGNGELIGSLEEDFEANFATDTYIATYEVTESFSAETFIEIVYDNTNIGTEFV